MRRTTLISAALALLVALASPLLSVAGAERATENGSGRTYYVNARSGSDADSGTSRRQAWRSLNRVTEAELRAGDRVLLRRGSTYDGRLRIEESGVRGARIVVAAYGSGRKPVVTGDCIDLAGSYVTVKQLRVRSCDWAGVEVGGDHNRVAHSRITGNVAGVHVREGARRTRVVRNRIVDNDRMSVNTPGGDDDSGAFGVLLRGERTTVARNVISGHEADSHDYGIDGAAVEVYGAIGSRVHHNVARENHTFVELGDPRSRDNRFSYNVVTSGARDATFLVTRGAESGWGPIENTVAEHNTVRLTGQGSQGFICHAGCTTDILTLHGNIVQAVAKVGYADGPFNGSHNLFWGGETQFTVHRTSVVARPRFQAPAQNDLSLRRSSRAVDSAREPDWRYDVRGTRVPQDGDRNGAPRADRGAVERTR